MNTIPGAIGDGQSHPLSGLYSTLEQAQAFYPHAQSLSDEIDWCEIQGAVNSGDPILLTGGLSYVVNRQIEIKPIPNHSGPYIFDGDGSCKILPNMTAFDNIDRNQVFGNSGTILYVHGELSGEYKPLVCVRIGGFHIAGDKTESRYTFPIACRNVRDLEVTRVKITGFAAGYGLSMDTILGRSEIRDCVIADWFTNSTEYADKPTAQATGIAFDDNSTRSDGSADVVWSENVRVIYNNIRDLAKGPEHIAAYEGAQTDGIHLLQRTKRFQVLGNQIEHCDEGIDVYGVDHRIAYNMIRQSNIGMKFMHGASRNKISDNEILVYGLHGVYFGATEHGDVRFNHLMGNDIYWPKPGARACVSFENAGGACDRNVSAGNFLHAKNADYAVWGSTGSNKNYTIGDKVIFEGSLGGHFGVEESGYIPITE